MRASAPGPDASTTTATRSAAGGAGASGAADRPATRPASEATMNFVIRMKVVRMTESCKGRGRIAGAPAAGPGGGAADRWLDGQYAAARAPAGEQGREQLEGDAAEPGGVGHDRGQRRVDHAADVEPVEPDDRQVAGDAQLECARGQVRAGRDDVVVAE